MPLDAIYCDHRFVDVLALEVRLGQMRVESADHCRRFTKQGLGTSLCEEAVPGKHTCHNICVQRLNS